MSDSSWEARTAFVACDDGPERCRAHVEGRADIVAELPGKAPLDEAVAWARELAPTVLVRLDDEDQYRSAGTWPPAHRLTAAQWPRSPGDRLPEVATRWRVDVQLAPTFERLTDPHVRARCDDVVAQLATLIGADRVDTTGVDAALAEEAEVLRRAGGEEVGSMITGAEYELSVETSASSEDRARSAVERLMVVPDDWWSHVRCRPLDRPTPLPRPY